MPPTAMTLCFLLTETHILLGHKKVRLGAGLWTGYGGHNESGETIEQTAVRETFDESGIRPRNLTKHGVVLITYAESPLEVELHVFSSREFSGEPRETDEMIPGWFSLDGIPYPDMWSNDSYFLPMLLLGERFVGHFHLDNTSEKTILWYHLEEVTELPEHIEPWP